MIYVITHKVFEDSIIEETNYRILHVGENRDCKDNYQRDDTGDNISCKNPFYCELTGLYWIWKNADETSTDPVGLVHYRRFFTYPLQDILYTYFNRIPQILTYENIRNDLEVYDVILPTPEKICRTVSEYYRDFHNYEDLLAVRNTLKELYPEYIISFDKVMNEHYFYYGNMIITTKGFLDSYCEWLFRVLKDVENKRIGKEYLDGYQTRLYGFLGERLIQVWVEQNNLKIKTYPVFNTEQKRMTVFHKNLNRIKHVVKNNSKTRY